MDLYKKKRTHIADPYKKIYYNNGIELQPLVMILSYTGRLYCMNSQSKQIIWSHDTNRISYQAFHRESASRYVDIKDDDEYPYVYSSQHKMPVINWNNRDELHNQIKGIFKTELDIEMVDPVVFYLDKDSGNVVSEEANNSFKIRRTEFDFGILKSWYVRYSNIDVYLPYFVSGNGSEDNRRFMCRVHYARTAERLIQLCNQYGLRGLDDSGILTRTINNSRKKIEISYPKVFEDKESGICYFKGSVNGINAFVKRTPKRHEYIKKVKEVYTKFSRLESVVRFIQDESDEQFMYFAFEEMDMNLAEFIKTQYLKGDVMKQLGVLKDIVKGLIELHKHHAFHCNLSPESILINLTAADDIVVRFCGLGANASYSSEDTVMEQIEKQNLGKIMWNYFSLGDHCFVKTDYNPGFSTPTSHPKKVDLKSAHLVQKLVYQSSSIPLESVNSHIVFWKWDDHMSFLCSLSDFQSF